MTATVLTTFLDKKNGKRFSIGDVVSISSADFERINKQGDYLKQGRHRFGTGICYPCKRRLKNK